MPHALYCFTNHTDDCRIKRNVSICISSTVLAYFLSCKPQSNAMKLEFFYQRLASRFATVKQSWVVK